VSDDPAGVVLEQDPAGGAWASGDDGVRVVVSSGPAPVDVPDLVNLTVEDATARLDELGLVVAVTEQFHEEVDAGRVVSQSVPPGEEVAPDSTIDVVVSRGPAPVPVPDLRDQPYDAAAAALTDAGLTPARQDVFDNDVAEGRVIRTEPAAGTEVDRGSEVTVVVSRGPDLVEVPRVVGLTVEEASETLTDAGFEVEVEGRFRPGREVTRQTPAAGSRVPRGSVVTIRL
jgi:serine/threonine-protein kinase